MKKLLLLSCAMLSLIYSLSARDLSTTDGKTYKDVQILQITTLGLVFLCNGESGWVDFKDLPPDVQREFGYDADKSQKFEKSLGTPSGDQSVFVPPGANTTYDPSAFPAEAQPLPEGQQPPAGSVVVNVNDDTPASYNNIVCGGPSYCANYFVFWNGRYYPYYYWHRWYWHNHWVYYNGRYYPWDYYHHHGVWYHGQYYPYHHGLLATSEPWKKVDTGHNHLPQNLVQKEDPAKEAERRAQARAQFEKEQAERRVTPTPLPPITPPPKPPLLITPEHPGGGTHTGGGGGTRR